MYWANEPVEGFDRAAFIKERHDDGLPEECLEVLGIMSCGCADWEIGVALGLPTPRVVYWLSYGVNRLFGGWGDSKPTEIALVAWFMDHTACCAKGWERRISERTYPGLERLKRPQPGKRLERLKNTHLDLSMLGRLIDHEESLPPSRQRRVPRRCNGPTVRLLGFDPADPDQMAAFVRSLAPEGE